MAWIVGVFSALLLLPLSTAAVSTITQGYATKGSPSVGSIVSLQKDTSNFVDKSTPSNANNLLGVVVGEGNSLLSLSSGAVNQIQVATSGVVQVLVSDINGGIYEGDSIAASPISGVGMKATENVKVIGTVQGNLKDTRTSKQEYTDKNKSKQQVTLGQLPVLINVSYFYKEPTKTLVPTAVQNIANALAGKTVKPLPVLISMGIFIITLVVVASIIFSMIRGSIISVGRNPMAQSAVYRNVLQLSVLVLTILAAAVGAIYMILSRF